MARQERGVYEPSDEVRVFDGAEDDEDDAEGSRLPLVIVLALVVLCAFGGLVWLAYVQGVARGRTETPVLAAAPGPERVAPTAQGGAEVPYQGFKIYEQPAPQDEGDTEAPPPRQAAAPKPAPPPEFLPQTPGQGTQKPAIVAQQAAPAIAKPVPPPPAIAKPTPPPVTAKPAPPPPAATAKPAATIPSVATGAPRALPGTAATPAPQVAAATPAPATAKPAAPAAAGGGGYVLQIGAFKSQAEADAAWKVYSARHAALVKGYGPSVQAADLGEKGTWYRLRITGFADRDVASALCDRLKAQSGACILGR